MLSIATGQPKGCTLNRSPITHHSLLITFYSSLFTFHSSRLSALSNPYELFIIRLPPSYTGRRNSVCMREPINRKRLQKWQAIFGLACFAAGILAPLLGMLLLAIEWVASGVDHPWLHFTSTTLLIVGIPLILFAGFWLDWAERGQRENRPNSNGTQRGVSIG